MGKLSEYYDYLQRDPSDIDYRFIRFTYSHITVGEAEKKLRRQLRWYKQK